MKQRPIIAFILVLLCCGVATQAQAQEHTLELSSRYDGQGNAVIDVTHHDGAPYSVVVQFHELVNFSAARFQRMQVYSKGKLITLKPTNKEKGSFFGFRYNYVAGAVNPKRVDRDFVYRLPFSLSEGRKAWELRDAIYHYFGGNHRYTDFKGFQFEMERGDTIYAARKGVVLNVVDEYDPAFSMGEVTLDSRNNSVTVGHADGTKAIYSVLQRGSIAPKPGDTVYPGTPLALAGTFDGEVWHVRFCLYYDTDNLNEVNSLADYSVTGHGVDPLFSTSDGVARLTHDTEYTPASSREQTIAEMTKRELRASGL